MVVEALLSAVPPVSVLSRHRLSRRIQPQTRLATSLKYSGRKEGVGLNELHTLLKDAVEEQDFLEANRISSLMAEQVYSDYAELSEEEKRNRRRRMSWRGLGAAPWLADRLDMLSYTFPTTIQVSAFEAVNSMLGNAAVNGNNAALVDEDSTLEERIQTSKFDMGIVVSGATGSGKTLSYAVPLLSTLSDSLFLRQRLRIADEEAVGDTAGDLADRIDVVTSPSISSAARKVPRTIATGASIATLGRSGTDVKSPLALIVVPTRELGVQTARALYQLVGGSFREEFVVKKDKDTADSDLEEDKPAPKYQGPKGVRIGCVLEDEEAEFGLKLQTDVAITTPKYLGKLLRDGDIQSSKLRVIVYDEADLALEQTKSDDLSLLFDSQQKATRLTLLVGASVTKALGNLAMSSRILPEGQSYIASATTFSPLTRSGDDSQEEQDINIEKSKRTASLKDLDVCLYPGLKHERVVVGTDDSKLLALTKLLRKELSDYEDRAGGQSPRVVVFFPEEEEAKAAIEPLRDSLWGKHLLCVLLPNTGIMPLSIMEQFRKNKTSVMLATANSVRGLDFPALTHVYTLYLPMDDPREYLHLAGRVGRVGHRAEGRVISVLNDDEANELEKLATTLGFEYSDVEVPAETMPSLTDEEILEGESFDVEKYRRKFEDTLTFVKYDDEEVVDATVINSDEDEDPDIFG